MNKKEKLIRELKMNDGSWELKVLEKWIEEDGIDYVYLECMKMLADSKKETK